MVLIEGIGDEVIGAFGVLLVTLVGFIAWNRSTVSELHQVRTVFIVGTRTSSMNEIRESQESPPSDTGQAARGSNETTQANPESSTAEATITESCTSTDAVNARRLAYFSQQCHSSDPSCSGENSSNCPENVDEAAAASASESDPSIRIKLKYLNDDQKMVRGNLQESLGEFKRRYFEAELSSNKSVLLIFQGRVLNEQQTLERIGMYDNCVVHCLVKANNNASSRGATSQSQPATQPDPQWNLTGVLCSTVSLILISAWFAHINFPQFFTMTSTSILLCLTALFVVSIVGLYYPEVLSAS